MESELRVIQEDNKGGFVSDLKLIQDTKKQTDLSKNSIKQNYNNLKILWHPDKLKSFSEGKITAPIYVRVKPINLCNHHCFYCVYESDFSGIHNEMDHHDKLSYNKIMEILDDFKDIGVQAVTYSGGGEPLIYPHITETLKKTLDYEINLSMITNAQNLKGENADILSNANWIRVSTDAIDGESFSEIRKMPEHLFDEVVENIRNFASIKNSNCELGINFVVHEKSKDRIYEAVKFYKELGADHIKFSAVWKTPGFYEYHFKIRTDVINQIIRAKEDFVDETFKIYDTYENDLELTGKSKRTYSRCYVMQTMPIIGADSKVYYCHNKAYDDTGCLGSIENQSFKELWFSEESKVKFENFNPMVMCRHQCTNDMKNILINDALQCSGDHVNFV